jgi:hypothetical protein
MYMFDMFDMYDMYEMFHFFACLICQTKYCSDIHREHKVQVENDILPQSG